MHVSRSKDDLLIICAGAEFFLSIAVQQAHIISQMYTAPEQGP